MWQYGPGNFAFIQFMECLNHSDRVDEALGVLASRWSTDYEVDHTIGALVDSEKQPKGVEWESVLEYSRWVL